MTTGHRRGVIAEIKRLLDKGLDIQVVSTSLLEAGVDLDFPWVYRAWAPAESPQQAAGRCHRDGRLHCGTVVTFKPSDGKQPHGEAYGAAQDASETHFGRGVPDPDGLEVLERC
ncbi:hypothetical protein JK360_16290 [Streptomyces sp. 9-7]|uniref:CRISPR-associated nuclease/helicase Cas3 domain-containing protein n=2 Tax=Streptomyces TaxID=1883 RepID=A0ABS1MT37_9ACTN|nr:hypothetical protein [Streptomyces sp. 9-7]MBL1090942.1 hypothetical protein [Streptomyces sp. 9-7]